MPLMKPYLLMTALLGLSAIGGPAAVRAEDAGPADSRNLVVVELFTSQGCASCPPADALLQRLAARDDVLPLALHVDYWDYIGWADIFARPEYTLRQKAYARLTGSRMIYTPQMVIGGVTQLVGARPMELADTLNEQQGWPPGANLELARDNKALTISARDPAASDGPILVQLVRFQPEETVEIHQGENAGKTVTYANVVTEWKVLTEWNGAAPLHLEVPVEGSDAAAVILQDQDDGRILAAGRAD